MYLYVYVCIYMDISLCIYVYICVYDVLPTISLAQLMMVSIDHFHFNLKVASSGLYCCFHKIIKGPGTGFQFPALSQKHVRNVCHTAR